METLSVAAFSLRWIVHTTAWAPSTQQQEFLLSLLSVPEAKHVTKYVRVEDQKRALASQLLQVFVRQQSFVLKVTNPLIERKCF